MRVDPCISPPSGKHYRFLTNPQIDEEEKEETTSKMNSMRIMRKNLEEEHKSSASLAGSQNELDAADQLYSKVTGIP